MAEQESREGTEPRPQRSNGRKDRLIQTRVPKDLESTLKREARRRRLTVSHLIRNILEDTFQLVDDVVDGVDEIVSDSVALARRVGRDARRMAGAVRTVVHEDAACDDEPSAEAFAGSPERDAATAAGGAPDVDDELSHVFAWNAVIANRAAACARCDGAIERGAEAFVGSSDDPTRARVWLCAACREAL